MKRLSFRIFQTVLLSAIFLMHPWKANAQTAADGNSIYLPVVMQDYDSSWRWDSVNRISLPESPFHDPVIGNDFQGRTHLLWDNWSSGDQFIFHTYQTDSGWTTSAEIDQTLGASKVILPPMMGADGQLHLVWYNELALGGPYRLMADSFNISQWEIAHELVRYQYNSSDVAMNVSPNGSVNVVFGILGLIRTDYFFTQKTSAGWSAGTYIDPQLSYPYSLLKALPDQSGGVGLLIRNWNNSTLYYSNWKNGNISPNLFPIGVINTSNASFLDSQDNWHFFRTGSVPIPGGSVNGIYHQCMGSDLSLGQEEVLTGMNNVSDYSVTRDNNGKVVFSWTKLVNENKVLALEVLQGCARLKHNEYSLPALPNSDKWGLLNATAKTAGHPGKFCALYDIAFKSNEFGLFCAWVND